MKYEIKISFPFYKIAYVSSFIVILSLIRGVTATYEVGIAIEAPAAMLAVVCCADTYVQEIASKRAEVQCLYPMKRRIVSIGKRLLVQGAILALLEIVAYGLFYLFQKPRHNPIAGSETRQFFFYLLAMLVTTFFWSVLSNTLSIIFRNPWAGIGSGLVIWLTANSTVGKKLFGAWNLFSYTFRKVDKPADLSWLCGKAVCLCLTVMMFAVLPKLLRKRG